MPIHFACPHCSQKLSVASRKAGTDAQCPRCRQSLVIPTRVALPHASVSSPAGSGDEWAPHDDVDHDDSGYAFFDDTEITDEGELPLSDGAPQAPIKRIELPRSVIYWQGALLAVVGLLCFGLGMLAGGSLLNKPAPSGPQALTITGNVAFNSRGVMAPDAGAVVVVIPNIEQLEERIELVGLRPNDPLSANEHASLALLRRIGGAFARADAQGAFVLPLPDRGNYLLLVLSHSAKRDRLNQPTAETLAELGRYFVAPEESLAGLRFHWLREDFRGDQKVSVEFE